MSDYLDTATIAAAAFFIVLAAALLTRYRQASSRITESAELNHDLWKALEDRLRKQDERILDLVGRIEVMQARLVSRTSPERPVRQVMRRDMQPSPPLAPFELMAETQLATPPEGDLGDTEKAMIKLLGGGTKSTTDIKKVLGLSREHTARMLKALFDKGLVTRDDSKKPFVYQLTEKGRAYISP